MIVQLMVIIFLVAFQFWDAMTKPGL